MKLDQKTVSLTTIQIEKIQHLANNTTNGDFSAALRNILANWKENK